MDFNIDFEGLMEAVTSFGLKLIGMVLLLIGAWIVARWTRHSVKKSLQKTRLDVTLTKFFSNITGWLILVLAVLTALSVFGINTTSFAAVIGAAGLAVGLAFQGTLSNFAAGVMLLTFRPFKVGDAVQAAGQTGIIDEIDLLMTKMDTFDNRRIVIPSGLSPGPASDDPHGQETSRLGGHRYSVPAARCPSRRCALGMTQAEHAGRLTWKRAVPYGVGTAPVTFTDP